MIPWPAPKAQRPATRSVALGASTASANPATRSSTPAASADHRPCQNVRVARSATVSMRANIQSDATSVRMPSSIPRSRTRKGSTGPITETKT